MRSSVSERGRPLRPLRSSGSCLASMLRAYAAFRRRRRDRANHPLICLAAIDHMTPPADLVGQADDLHPSGVVEEQVSVSVRQNPLDARAGDALLPQTGDSVTPAGRRWPLLIDVRFVQDPISLAPAIMSSST